MNHTIHSFRAPMARLALALALLAPALGTQAQSHQKAIYDSTSVVMEETGLSHVIHHMRIRMDDRTGCRDNSVVKADYDPLSAYVEIRSVIVHRAKGRVDTIKSPVLDYVAPARSIYWGASQKMVEVGHLDPGDELEFTTYKKGFTYALLQAAPNSDEQYIPPMRGHFYDIVPFHASYPVKEQVYRLKLLKSKNLRYYVYHDDTLASKQVVLDTAEEGDWKIYTFSKRDMHPYPTEPNMVASSDVFTKLLLSTTETWQEKSLWFHGVNENYGSFNPTPELEAKVRSLLVDAESEFDSLNILCHWVADNMRYSGISMGKGEGYTLHNAKMNFTDRCGVCKDKASLLIAMLRAAGFKAYPVMTMAGSHIDRIPADQFNHSVAVAKLKNGKYQLLDPTWVPNVRELWSSAEQQQGYLMGVPEGADLMYTPISDPENHYIKVDGQSEILKDGTLRGSFTISAEGQSDMYVRLVFDDPMKMWQHNLEYQLLRIDPRAKITSITHTDNDEYLKQPVSITYHYEIPNYATVTSKEIVFIPFTAREIFRYAMRHLFINTTPEVRVYPFKDRCSRLIQISEKISLPNNYKQLHYPAVYGVADHSASFGCELMMNDAGNEFTFGEVVRMGKREYNPEDWMYVRQCILNQDRLATTPVVLSR